MGTGRLRDTLLRERVTEAVDVPGDFAEIGVFRGQTFKRLAEAARTHGRVAHAFDSFLGMAPPGPRDGKDLPEGKMGVGGVGMFRSFLDGVPPEAYRLHPGFIPHCFDSYEGDGFCFIYLDVDHYEPTRLALRWLWPLLTPGGVLGMDDYFPYRRYYASPAIRDFFTDTKAEELGLENDQLWVRKPFLRTLKRSATPRGGRERSYKFWTPDQEPFSTWEHTPEILPEP